MKTIFDFNPTERELDGAAIHLTKDEYLAQNYAMDKINLDIATLCSFRKQKIKMYWYLSKVKSS